jgi:hypothetical protein
VVHAQAYMNPEGRDYAVAQLTQSVDPETIISAITARSFDPDAARRQYGIVDRQGRFASFTGGDTDPHASHVAGFDGRFSWAVQGNLLTGAPVIERTMNAFLAGACDLPERLLRAMEAGAENGEGDNRCTPNGLPADSAFLVVVSPLGEAEDLVFVADEAETESPLVSLRAQLQAWRAFHPCPSPAEDAGPASVDASAPVDADVVDSGSPLEEADSCQGVRLEGSVLGTLCFLALSGLGIAFRNASPKPRTISAPAGPRKDKVRSSLS